MFKNKNSFLKSLKASAAGWRATISAGILGSKGGPGGAGGKLGIIGRVGQVFSSIGNSIRGIFTAATATKFQFQSPVYVMENVEYALVVKTHLADYKIWITNLGDQEIGGTRNSRNGISSL